MSRLPIVDTHPILMGQQCPFIIQLSKNDIGNHNFGERHYLNVFDLTLYYFYTLITLFIMMKQSEIASEH
eukprot:scaffold148520_cov43-Cyclotella_meneghiniana.AAC.4